MIRVRVGSPNSETAPNDVRYLRQFGEYMLTTSFTALDPFEKFAIEGRSDREAPICDYHVWTAWVRPRSRTGI